MKKVLFGSAAALLTVVGFSSFKSNTTKVKLWVKSGVQITPATDPIVNGDYQFTNSGITCGGAQNYVCSFTINTTLLTTSKHTSLVNPATSTIRVTSAYRPS